MTNGELYLVYQTTDDKAKKYAVVEEMTRRIHRNMITPDVIPIFTQYKLNGANDQLY